MKLTDSRWFRFHLFLIQMVVGLTGCGLPWQESPTTLNPSPEPVQEGLAFEDLLLKQTDTQGRLLWQLQTKAASYGQDPNLVQVQGLEGELFQSGKPTFKLKAGKAEVQQQGERLLLRGQVVVTDQASQGTLSAQEFEWRPQEELLLARKQTRFQSPLVQITAREMRHDGRRAEVTAQGQVAAVSQQTQLRLLTERLVWQSGPQQILAGTGLQASGVVLQRLNQTDRAQGGQLRFNLQTQTLVLQSPAQLRLANPAIEIDGDRLTWEVNRQRLSSDRPLQIRSLDQGMSVRANQAEINLATERLELSGAVRAVGVGPVSPGGNRNRAVLQTDQLVWQIPQQEVTAQGNVFYRQVQPPLTVRGNRAIGRLQEQKVLVTGGVVTEILP